MFDITRATPEQKQVLLEKDKNILVSAAAGSGKTTVMIERIVRTILNEKVPVENFLIITFTKASAEDMKNKLTMRLQAENPTPFILSQIDSIPVSDVSNLHSFCARLLKSYFYVVGLDPTFVVIDDMEQKKLQSRALDRLFDSEAKSGSEAFYKIADILSNNRKDGKLRDQILKLHNFSKSIYGFESWFDENLNESFNLNLNKNKCSKIILNYAKNIVFLFKAEIENLKNDIHKNIGDVEDGKKLIEYLDSIDTHLSMLNTYNFEVLAGSVKTLPKFKTIPKVALENELWQEMCKELKTDVKARIDTISNSIFASSEDTLETVKEALISTRENILILKDLFSKFETIYADLKKDQGVLDFNDLEEYALKVLSDDQTCEAIKNKYKYIFVDEYQDINSCQEKIISLISGDANRFMVGDIKQSIYGFRLCDPEIFLEKYNSYKMDGEKSTSITLNKNFRSHAEILEFVNIIFDETMTKSFGGVDYKYEARLVPGKVIQTKEIKPRACIMYMNTTGIEKESVDILEKLPVYSVKNHQYKNNEDTKKAHLEGLMIANKISELLTSNYFIEDKETKKIRKIEYRDIVLLVQSRNEYLNNLLDVLDSFSIPVSSDITSDVFEDEDILSIKNFLLVLSNFNQDKPLFSLMYSNLFGFSPNELAEIRLKTDEKYFYNAVNNYPEDDSPLYLKIISFKSKIETYKKLSSYMMVKDLCYRIIREFNIENYLLASPNYSERSAKLHKFLSSLPDTTIEEFMISSDFSNISCESKTAMNSVRVMTIHKSKGLEFPVVFLIGTGNKFNMKSVTGDIVISKDLGVCMNHFDSNIRYKSSTITRQASKILENKKFFEEQQRLLYVALTRAIDYLFVSAAIGENELKTKFTSTPTRFIDWFSPLILDNTKGDFCIEEYSSADFEMYEPNSENRQVLVSAPSDNMVKRLNNAIIFDYPYEKYTRTPQKTTVTKIVSSLDDDVISKEIDYANVATSSAERGTMYHTLLEKMTLLESSIDDIESLKHSLAEKKLIDSNKMELVDSQKLLNCINIKEFKEIVKYSDWIKKELEFYMLLGDSVDSKDCSTVQGIVDLLISVNGQLVLIDYKTGLLNEQLATKKYKTQLELYRMAIEKVYNQKVNKMYVLAIDMEELYLIK